MAYRFNAVQNISVGANGNNNTAIGVLALKNNFDGHDNTAVGVILLLNKG